MADGLLFLPLRGCCPRPSFGAVHARSNTLVKATGNRAMRIAVSIELANREREDGPYFGSLKALASIFGLSVNSQVSMMRPGSLPDGTMRRLSRLSPF